MYRKLWLVLLVLSGVMFLVSCQKASPAADANMPNPASVYCEENGGKLEIREDASGGQIGICVFDDGSECDEWAYFRKECKPGDSIQPEEANPADETNLPNPASVYCEENGGKLEIRKDASGGEAGICVFDDGSECDEWAYFRNECKPGDSLAAPDASEPQEAAPAEGWKIYRHETLGYRFEYPEDAEISSADDPLKTLTITGPLVADEHWPVIFISHPSDREDYLPPDGVDLEQWLKDHNLLMVDPEGKEPTAEAREPDVQIAGSTAIHTRLARSPQTYAYDKYFFSQSGQLYTIVILHAGDKEDWDLYNHFLDSFRFE